MEYKTKSLYFVIGTEYEHVGESAGFWNIVWVLIQFKFKFGLFRPNRNADGLRLRIYREWKQ